ncbi:uncharacterized protein [Haliotis cracherodii]|uniref:uncharacterized protein n=1 Tax=Haliotis cracherodii TaxID=6455 RepID=UPI0039E97610
MAYLTTNRVLGSLLMLLWTDGVAARNRYSEGRTTTGIVVGCCILAVFLLVVAVCSLYCKFCTKRKREEWKWRNKVIPSEILCKPEAEVVEERVPTIDVIPPLMASGEKTDKDPNKGAPDQKETHCGDNISDTSNISLSTDRKVLSPIEVA